MPVHCGSPSVFRFPSSAPRRIAVSGRQKLQCALSSQQLMNVSALGQGDRSLRECSGMWLEREETLDHCVDLFGHFQLVGCPEPTVMPTSRSGLMARKRRDVGRRGQGSSGAKAWATLQRASAPTPFQAVTPRTTALRDRQWDGAHQVEDPVCEVIVSAAHVLDVQSAGRPRRSVIPVAPRTSCTASRSPAAGRSGQGQNERGTARTGVGRRARRRSFRRGCGRRRQAYGSRPLHRTAPGRRRSRGSCNPLAGASLRPQPRRSSAVTVCVPAKYSSCGRDAPFGRSTSRERTATPGRRSRPARSRASARRVPHTPRRRRPSNPHGHASNTSAARVCGNVP